MAAQGEAEAVLGSALSTVQDAEDAVRAAFEAEEEHTVTALEALLQEGDSLDREFRSVMGLDGERDGSASTA